VAEPERQRRREGGLSTRQKARLAGIAVLVLVVGALVVDNTDEVTIGYVFGESEVSLVVLILVAWVLGIAIGWLGSRRDRD
jgi:uncharacterized integral membrane protein